MRRFIAAGAAALLFSVAACSSTPIVHVTPAELSADASLALGALEAGADAYLMQDPNVSAQTRANIRRAEDAARAAVATIGQSTTPYDLKTGARAAVEAIGEIAGAIPPGTLSPTATASITAFLVAADVVIESIPSDPTPPKPTPTKKAAS